MPPTLYPPVEPFDTGLLDVGAGHRIYWERCGNPHGRPAVFLHGGPGSGCSPNHRRFFDPARYGAVLFDQRGCGRSTPLADDPGYDLDLNTTHHLIADLERLRQHLRIDAWTVAGVSWGTTLALAYAQAHPERVTGVLLALVTTTTRREVDWITVDMGRVFPAEWDTFRAAVPEHLRDLRPVDAYATMLADPDPAVRAHAAGHWRAWEDAHVSLAPGHTPDPRFRDARFRERFARLVTHYWRHAAFMPDGQLLAGAGRLAGIPGHLVHGRFDVSSPLEVPWRLVRAWPGSELQVLEMGHGGGDAFAAAVVSALDRLAG